MIDALLKSIYRFLPGKHDFDVLLEVRALYFRQLWVRLKPHLHDFSAQSQIQCCFLYLNTGHLFLRRSPVIAVINTSRYPKIILSDSVGVKLTIIFTNAIRPIVSSTQWSRRKLVGSILVLVKSAVQVVKDNRLGFTN